MIGDGPPVEDAAMRTTRLIAPLAATAAVAAAALPATASAGVGGNYAGDAVHPLPAFATPDWKPFESKLVMTISDHKGGGMRLTGLVATIRLWCGETAINDVRIVKGNFKGPRVAKNGSFAYRVKGVSFEGQVRKGYLTGYASGGNHECGVEGVKFRLRRARTL